jgi:hypothetical protein
MLFTVEIDEEWLDALGNLIQTTLGNAKAGIIGGSVSSPEEVLTVSIFFQLRLQRIKTLLNRKNGRLVMFPYDPQPQELTDYWEGYEDSPSVCWLDDEIEGKLIPRCFSCGAEAEEWDTACFECGGPVG